MELSEIRYEQHEMEIIGRTLFKSEVLIKLFRLLVDSMHKNSPSANYVRAPQCTEKRLFQKRFP